MSYGVQTFTAASVATFDSSLEFTQLAIDERVVLGGSVGNGVTFQYPDYAGKKISACMASPYQNGSTDGWAVLSCRVTYSSGVPWVSIFVDNTAAGLPVCDGLLQVFLTGAAL